MLNIVLELPNPLVVCENCGKMIRQISYGDHKKRCLNIRNFPCTYCDKAFVKKHDRFRHEKINHSGIKDHICDKCGIGFYFEYHLKRHVKRVHSSESHPCPTCGKIFKNLSSMLRHSKLHNIPRPFRCDCGTGFSTSAARSRHKKKCSSGELKEGPRPFQCSVCSEKFSEEIAKASHEATVQHIFCEHCNKGFATKNRYRSHINIVHTSKVCRYCNESFTQKKFTRKHEIRQHELPFQCEECKRRFSSEDEKSNHNCNQGFPCDQCDKVLLRRDSIRRHMREVHKVVYKKSNIKTTKTVDLCCNYCGLKCNSQNGLNIHKKLQPTPRFRCSVCLKRFSNGFNLEYHQCEGSRKLFSCDICSHGFQTRFNMMTHRKVHTHKFKCYRCKKKFMEESSLRNHVCMKAHKKPIVPKPSCSVINRCKICMIDFVSHRDYINHKKQHENFPCPHCPKRYTSQKLLWSHVDWCHKDTKMHRLAATYAKSKNESGPRLSKPPPLLKRPEVQQIPIQQSSVQQISSQLSNIPQQMHAQPSVSFSNMETVDPTSLDVGYIVPTTVVINYPPHYNNSYPM